MSGLQIAIDGPAGSGKSSAARLLARRLGYVYVDTGALYRAIALISLNLGLICDDNNAAALLTVAENLNIFRQPDSQTKYLLDDEDITEKLRAPEVNKTVSQVAKVSSVRRWVNQKLHDLACSGSVVMDGRDIGTVVLPAADVKIYLTADIVTRARRRRHELLQKGFHHSQACVEKEVACRDSDDESRSEAPLKKAFDAVVIDSTNLSLDQVVDLIVALIVAEQKKRKAESGGDVV